MPAPSAKSPCLLSMIGPRRLATLLLCMAPLGVKAARQEDKALAAARSLIQENKNEEAIVQLKGLAETHPEWKGIAHELGVAYYHQGEYLEAAKYLENAWRKDPDDRDAAQLLGLSHYFSGRPAAAIPPLEKVRLWHPNANIDAIYILGLCYILNRNYPQALETFARLYSLDRNSAAAHLMLGRILLRQGFDPVSETEVRKALAVSPHLPLAHFTLGEFYAYTADYRKAAKEFEQELAFNPGYAPAFTHLGDAYWRLNRYDDAQRVLQDSIWLDSTSAEPYVILGKVLIAKRQLVLAERTLQRATGMDPGNYSAHYFLGQLYRELGKVDAAERELKTAAQIQQAQAQNAPRIR